jgi:hypothetical protein
MESLADLSGEGDMRITQAGCLAALGLGLGVTVALAQKPANAPTPAESSWWSSWFGAKKEEKKNAPKPKVAPSATERVLEQEKLMKAYLRRLEVCDRLRDIAHETNNNSLFDEATHLENLAWKLYQNDSNKLMGSATAVNDEAPLEKSNESTIDLLKRRSPGGDIPPRLRNGGRLETSRAEVPMSRKEDK